MKANVLIKFDMFSAINSEAGAVIRRVQPEYHIGATAET